MKTERQILIVGGIVLAGLAVLPFARRADEPEPAPHAAESVRAELPLHVPVQIANSPATLHDQDAPPGEPQRVTLPSIAASRLEDNGLPPELPERYHPLVDGPPADHFVAPRALQRPDLPAAEVESPTPSLRTHKVKDGDTLPKLAQRYWGDASQSDQLFEANREILASPDPLPIGVVLQIPEKPISLPKPKLVAQPSATAGALPAPVRQPSKADTLDQLPLVPLK